MKKYKVRITSDKYPTDWEVEASSWHTAVARAVKQWQQRFKGSRVKELYISIVKI